MDEEGGWDWQPGQGSKDVEHGSHGGIPMDVNQVEATVSMNVGVEFYAQRDLAAAGDGWADIRFVEENSCTPKLTFENSRWREEDMPQTHLPIATSSTKPQERIVGAKKRTRSSVPSTRRESFSALCLGARASTVSVFTICLQEAVLHGYHISQ